MTNQQANDYQTVADAIHYLEQNFRKQPSLDEIAASVHLSKYHFQRLFKRWAGVSPTQFLHYLTVEYAKQNLQQADTVFNTALDAGLSSAGRLHDLFVTFEAMSPGEYKRQGDGLTIQYNFSQTPFGEMLIAQTARGVCALRFVSDNRDNVLNELMREWEQAEFAFSADSNLPNPFATAPDPIHLHLKGTNFQVQVWQALLRIPAGRVVTYSDVSHAIGNPQATRAVASAIAKNPVGYIIPCHRVINKVGQIHKYRWGTERKKAMIGWEASQSAANGAHRHEKLQVAG